ncbi:CBF-domain-containing protein [Yamadazyma tenuis ATCC 10573]|nr:CBF-domain-containing protein [Yamadazyma tenuis ATCC 10573]EGV66852.1 CBF-domain-containing protein [Yamadazyma tenuis ATCC 10573]
MYQFLSTSLSFKSSLQLDILDVSLNVLRLENQYLKSSKDDLYFPTSTYKAIVKSLVCSEVGTVLSDNTIDDFIMLEFQEKLHKYYDLQFYFFQCLNELVEQDEIPDQNRLFSIFYTLVKIPLAFEENPKELRAIKTFISKPPTTIFKPSHFKKAFQTLVISILSFKLTSSQYKCILLILNKRILPYLAQPSRLMDFLTDSYDTSDLIIQILALNSLYELMKQYNLEYPDFYTKLYSLLTPELLFNRYRSRFFRLSDLFLSSTHLSSNLVASFIKKLARLSITGPAPGVVIIIPFIYNLFKRHPSCMIMIQNPSQDPDTYEDPYDNNELDPLKTNAINSSLWELEALMNHYHPNISTLAKIFTEPFRKPNYNLEDFLDWSFKSLIESEINRKYRSMAALEFDSFDQLFDHVTGTSEGSEPESKTTVYLEGWTI